MDPKTILCVDDEQDITELLSINLKREGFNVLSADNGKQALKIADSVHPDLFILDVMMPGMDGFELCKKLRNDKSFDDSAIFFLTAKDDEVDEILGLEYGADDYILKPFNTRKIAAKVKSVLKRYESKQNNENLDLKLTFKNLIVDKEQFKVTIDGNSVRFIHKEFELLYFLLSRKNKVFSRDELLKYVWGEDVFFVARTVDVHITKIRKKLGKYAKNIETISGVGYMFTTDIH
jgi:two-component system alkaline phosphatase synthesis response regulator PhoP